MKPPLRILTAVPICDGHDSAINTVNLELIRSGIEVIYLGYHRSARAIVRAAIQEDVRGIGISSYNGGHVEFFSEVVELLKKQGASNIGVFGGGGGTITQDDVKEMTSRGVDRIFFAGTPLSEMVEFVKAYASRSGSSSRSRGRKSAGASAHSIEGSDRAIAKLLTNLKLPQSGNGRAAPPTIGITGPGGAGKTTLIDELVRRYLRDHPKHRIAILSHDPSIIGNGALLGDRATMIYSQDDRVFMRSLATRGASGGLSSETAKSLQILKACGPFDLIIVETVGIGQEALPFAAGAVDKSVLVMSPDYGARLQLQKIVMLDAADVVVVNKGDLAGARTAANELEQRLRMNGRGQTLIATVAKQHNDAGVDQLLRIILSAGKQKDEIRADKTNRRKANGHVAERREGVRRVRPVR